MTTTTSRRTSDELAQMFLNGRANCWISAKQASWLFGVAGREGGPVNTASYVQGNLPGGGLWTARRSGLNGAALLKTY